MLTKEQVLAADDATLNHWAAVYVMGWEYVDNQSGNAYHRRPDPPIHPSDYDPATDRDRAMDLVDYLRTKNWWCVINVRATEYKVNFGNSPYATSSHTDPSLPRAITIAALLAVASDA